MASGPEQLLAVEPLRSIPGIRAFARRVDLLWESTQVFDRAWNGAAAQARAAGEVLTGVLPDFEALSIRWRAFVDDVRELVRDALRWFRSSARAAVEYANGLIRELDEFLGLTAAWAELRDWVLRELRSLRSGPTARERLDRVETSAGVTIGLLAAAGLAGLGLWAWLEWRKATQAAELAQQTQRLFAELQGHALQGHAPQGREHGPRHPRQGHGRW